MVAWGWEELVDMSGASWGQSHVLLWVYPPVERQLSHAWSWVGRLEVSLAVSLAKFWEKESERFCMRQCDE